VGKDLSYAKVSNLDDPLLGEEHILSLQVSVDDLPVMDVLQTKTDLGEPLQNLLL